VEDLHGGEGRRVRWEDERDREEFVIGKVGAHAPSLLPRASVLLSTARPATHGITVRSLCACRPSTSLPDPYSPSGRLVYWTPQ
jgi:hypothetical protein